MVGIEATGPNSSSRSVSTPMPLIASAPSATATARSVNARVPHRARAGHRRGREGHCRRARHHPLAGRACPGAAQPRCHRTDCGSSQPGSARPQPPGLDVRLDPAQQARLAKVSAIELGFPRCPAPPRPHPINELSTMRPWPANWLRPIVALQRTKCDIGQINPNRLSCSLLVCEHLSVRLEHQRIPN
jgi:hypothetical protein